MTEMRDWDEFSDGPLVFPYKGKKYTAPEISIDLGMRLNAILNEGAEADLPVAELWPVLLGDAWSQMVADSVPLVVANRAGATMLADFQFGREYATAMWETGGDPALAAELMTKRAAGEATPTAPKVEARDGE